MNIDRTKTPPRSIDAFRANFRHADVPVQPDHPIYTGPGSIMRKSSCACGGGCPSCQGKADGLEVSHPNDAAELEADNIAEQIMRMPADANPAPKIETGSASKNIQRKGNGNVTPGPAPGSGLSGGRPLDSQTREFFEPRLGADLGGVRVHTGEQATRSARDLNALAYTVGQDVVFGAGQYDPHSFAGQKLLAHELVHTMQQSGGRVSRKVQRQPTPESPAPAYGQSCTGGPTDPCQVSRCDPASISGIYADITKGIEFVDNAIAALNTTPLAAETVTGLDMFFNSHSAETAKNIAATFLCIRRELQDTIDNSRFGCNPDYPKLAYVCAWTRDPCGSVQTDVCLANAYFEHSDRIRAQIMVHECSHRAGMSTWDRPDTYRYDPWFYSLTPEAAMLNSDSYSLFAGALAEGFPTTVRGLPWNYTFNMGIALPSKGDPTWQAKLYIGTEAQNPVLGIFNPTLGLGFSLIGESSISGSSFGTKEPLTSPVSFLGSLVAGITLADPKPYDAGGGTASVFGGPAIGLSKDKSVNIGLGAEAGVAVGYRWKVLDVSLGMTYAYDPTREAGMEHLFVPGLSITFSPFVKKYTQDY